MATLYQNIPPTMAQTPQWLGYKIVDTGKPRLSKPPFSPRTGKQCAKNDETEFCTLHDALIGMERFDLDGVGFVFVNGFVAIDLDDCFDEKGNLNSVPQNIFDHFTNTYWETSPSGNGLHGFMLGEKPNNRTKDTALGIEVYEGFNFVTVTGDIVEYTAQDTTNMQDALEWLYETYLPPIIINSDTPIVVDHGELSPDEWFMRAMETDEKLCSLYNCTDHETDESSHDMSLLTKLAYALNRDKDVIERKFLASPWVASKDKPHKQKLKRKDYLPITIDKAMALTTVTAQENSKRFGGKLLRLFSSNDAQHYEMTDLGNSELMKDVYSDILCYTPGFGWCYYDGIKWESGVEFRAMEAARDIAQEMFENAKHKLSDAQTRLEDKGIDPNSKEGKEILSPEKTYYAHAVKTQSERGIKAMVNLNKAYMLVDPKEFKEDAWLINTPNGVVDLKTGELMPHDSKYKMMNMTACAPADIPTPQFDSFLNRIFCGDKDLTEYMQTVIGSSLVGKVYSENLIMATGEGSNGKSTLFNLIHHLLGDYSVSIDPELLMSSRSTDQKVSMSMLQGKRFAVAQETEEGQRLRSSMLKRLVTTDSVVAKRLYENPEEFTPTHTLILATNHLPKISSTDKGTWRRIVVAPFNATIHEKDMITDFHSLLLEREGAGILKWAIDGAIRFNELGCVLSAKPQAVLDASAQYRNEEDWIEGFLSETCEYYEKSDINTIIRHDVFYRAYRKWAESNGEYRRSAQLFIRAMQTAGWKYEPKHKNTKTGIAEAVWYGIKLVNGEKNVMPFRVVDRKAQQC